MIIIDYTGPYQTFGHIYAYNQPNPFNIYTVAEKQTAITTAFGRKERRRERRSLVATA